MVKALIFDIDGVLIDSQKANLKFFQDILARAGYKSPPPEDIYRCFHMSMYDAIKQLIGLDNRGEVERVYRIGRDEVAYPVELVEYPENVESIVGQLSERYTLGIATSRVRNGLAELLKQARIDRFFEAIVSFEDYSHPKPDPEPLLLAAARLKVYPAEAVYIGDSDSDIQAASAAGMKSIHLSEVPAEQADVGVPRFELLPRAVNQLADQG
jgi:HAD superfamily hydrolase (TIGR01509 family)